MIRVIRSGKWGRQVRRAEAFAVLACVFYVTACGGDSSNGGGSACDISGCGGDIKGTWDVTSICVSVAGLSTPSTGVAACDAVARAATDNAKVVPMPMTVTFTDTDYTLSGTAEFQFQFVYTKACLTAQGGGGASQSTCDALQSGLGSSGLTGTCTLSGEACACNATLTMPVNEHTAYHVDGTKLVSANESSPFCVKGDTAQFSSSNSQLGGSFSLKRAAAQTP
jgi:hypothetical protein